MIKEFKWNHLCDSLAAGKKKKTKKKHFKKHPNRRNIRADLNAFIWSPNQKHSIGHLYTETDQFINGIIPNFVYIYKQRNQSICGYIPRLTEQCLMTYSLAKILCFLQI